MAEQRNLTIRKAVRTARFFRGCFAGVSGSGKTFTALSVMTGLVGPGQKIVVIDSEQSSSELYAEHFEFDVISLPQPPHIGDYISALKLAWQSGAKGVIVDSATHAWEDVLEEVDAAGKRSRGQKFQAWGDVGTPLYKKFRDALLRFPGHVIVTLRSKSDYMMEEYTDERGNKKQRPVKVGLAPQFRQGGEYEFDVVANIDLDHNFVVEKSRLKFLADRALHRPDSELGEEIRIWFSSAQSVDGTEPAAADPVGAQHHSGADTDPVRAPGTHPAVNQDLLAQYEGGQLNPWRHRLEGTSLPETHSSYRGKALCEIAEVTRAGMRKAGTRYLSAADVMMLELCDLDWQKNPWAVEENLKALERERREPAPVESHEVVP